MPINDLEQLPPSPCHPALLVDEADAVDEAEDEQERVRPPVPAMDPHLSRRGGDRQARIRQALGDLESEKAAAQAAQDRKRDAQQARIKTKQPPGRRSLARRGLDVARTEFLPITIGSNLLKAYKAR